MRETYLARANETGGREPPAESLAAVKTALVAARKWLRQYALFNALAYGVAVVRNESGDVATTDEASALLKSVNPVVDYRANLREFIAVAKARGAQVVLIDEVQNTRGKAPDAGTFFAEPMRQTAAEEGVYFLPAARFFNRLPEHVSYFVPWDHVHLNAAGHQAVAEMIARFLFEQQLFPPFN
jgi:lysophospholipase L1-like esterase